MPSKNIANKPFVLTACIDQRAGLSIEKILSADFRISNANTWQEALIIAKKQQPAVVLLNPAFFAEDPVVSISKLFALSPNSRILIIEREVDAPIDQVALFKGGVHGFCSDAITPELLHKAVTAVCKDERWIQRKLISQLIDELAKSSVSANKSPDPQKLESLGSLTPRELEVANMVSQGNNNKLIARRLNISERTVKAHLSAIFRKLHINSRLHLALFFKDIA